MLYELEHNLGNGHVFLPRPKLLAATEQLIGAPPELVEQALDTLESRGTVVEEQIARVDACYLRRMYLAESETARPVAGPAGAPRPQGRGVEKLIREMEEQQSIAYAPQQRQAVELAARTGVLLLTRRPRHPARPPPHGASWPFSRAWAFRCCCWPPRPCCQAHERAVPPGGPDHPPGAGNDL